MRALLSDAATAWPLIVYSSGAAVQHGMCCCLALFIGLVAIIMSRNMHVAAPAPGLPAACQRPQQTHLWQAQWPGGLVETTPGD
jgi:hypothetical protein